MSKSTKIVVSLLIVAGFVCLAIGTIFACDYISQSNNSVALDKKQVIVASAERFALPNVRIDEPLQDIEVPVDGFAPGVYRFDLSVLILNDPEYAGDIFVFSEYAGVRYFDFILLSTNLPTFQPFVGNEIKFDLYFPTAGSQFASLNIEEGDGFFSEISLDGTVDYFLEVQAIERFGISLNDVPVSFISVPSWFFRPVVEGTSVVNGLVGILVSGLTGIGQGLGESLSPIADSIFTNADGDGLSVFATLLAVFAAISLGLTFTRFVLNFVTSWGNRNR